MVALGGQDAFGTWQQLELLMTQWRAVEMVAADDGPFIYNASRSGLRRIALD